MALIVALAAWLSRGLVARLPRPLRFILVLPAGLLFGLVATSVPVIFLGPWAMAFSFPLPLPMIAGSLAAFASLATAPMQPERTKYLLDLSLMVALAGIFTLLSGPVYDLLRGDTQLKVTFIEWQRAAPASEIEDPRNLLSQEEEQRIQSFGLDGKLLPRGQHSRGDAPRVHMMVILQSHIGGSVELPIPERDTVVFVVEEGRWRMAPEAAQVTGRHLRVEMPGASGNDLVRFRIEHVDGSETGGSAFGWSAPGP